MRHKGTVNCTFEVADFQMSADQILKCIYRADCLIYICSNKFRFSAI